MGLRKAAFTVSSWTLVSRISGLIRDQMAAAVFGVSTATDAFNIAFRIPNLLRRLFAEGAFASAFVPIISSMRAKEGDEATGSLVDAVATVLFLALVLTCALGIAGASWVVWAFGAGLQEYELAVTMTRWMFPYLLLISLVALGAGVLNSLGHFAVPAATPLFLNVGMIGATLVAAPWFARYGIHPIHSQSAGVLLGGALQLGMVSWALWRVGALPRIGLTLTRVRAAWHHSGVRHVLRQMGPAVLGMSVSQVSMLINSQIASQLPTGSVTWMFYAERLMEFPTALLGVTLGTVLMPSLAALTIAKDDVAYARRLDWGLRLVVVLALPCSVSLLVFAVPMLSTLFHHGRFDARAVQMTALALQGYGSGLLGMIAVKVLVPGFYARGDISTPVKVAVGALVCTQLFNFVLVPHFAHAGLALATGLGATVNAVVLAVLLNRRGLYRPTSEWWGLLTKVAVGSVLMGLWMFWLNECVDWIGLGTRPLWRAALLGGSLAGSAAIYFGTLHALGFDWRALRDSQAS
ncbi:MAG: murein biosynthesis integral membrane protein MurJ [Rhodoferax sp.]|nr:murein biosynthesis integral membrane protein MurJ [Rhodoferax sp.]